MKLPKSLLTKLVTIGLGATMALGVGLTASRGFDEVRAASPVTVDGTSFTTTDEDQTATIDGVTIGGFLKQYQTTKLWFTSGKGYIYNSTDLGSITKLTLSYNSGGSAAAVQRFNFGTSAMTSYLSTGGTTRNVSTGGTSYVETGGVGKGFFNISVSSKNLQLVTLVIEYSGSSIPTYTVSFDSAGGTPAPTSLTVSQNGTFTFPSPGTKSGYIFDGWSSDGGTTKFSAGATSPAVTAAINYTAYWSAVPTLLSINITGNLSKTSYFTTDSWSPAGLTVTGTYSSGPTQDVTSQVTWSYNPTAPNNVSITSVTVTATLGSQTDSENVTGITVTEKPSTIVISEAYGGGGNTGATYKQDFIELYNNTNTNINLTGYYLFYASATGTFNTSTTLSGTILAKSYFLVQEKAGTGGTVNIPTSDVTGTIDMGGTNLKLALTNSSTVPTTPTSSNVVDFLGAGTANAYEGSAAAPALSNATSVARVITNGVAIDTDNNGSDFTAGEPTPMNSALSIAEKIMAEDTEGQCVTKYSEMKALVLQLEANQLAYFKNGAETLMVNARDRYEAWAANRGDATPYASGTPAVESITTAIDNKEFVIYAIVIAVMGISTVAGFYFLKKKKETF